MQRYALLCADLLSDRGNCITSHGQIGEVTASLPPAPDLDKDTEWQMLPAELVGDIFQFPIEIRRAQDEVNFLHSVADSEEAELLCADKAAMLGMRSLDLSARLRSAAGLKRIELTGVNWDYRDQFSKQTKDASRRSRLD
ncbi:hypothetical protein RBI22_15125 [Alcaligenaceae bacterium C4P045]|nr:hypothetical protein [Alcaligenaceae bacterium C4P045]